MAEQTPQPKVAKVFDFVANSHEVNVMPVLAALVRKRRSIGLTEDDLTKESGLPRDEALAEVKKLEESGFVRSFLCQEGTAGPYTRRYKLVDGIEIKLEVNRPA